VRVVGLTLIRQGKRSESRIAMNDAPMRSSSSLLKELSNRVRSSGARRSRFLNESVTVDPKSDVGAFGY
jgi:hypothetical protein